ncbi:MAG: penicillin-binding transpeptidase domain-containing protein, partial [Bradyrhizobium sp.]
KAGRAKIIAVARKFGITTPLPDTPSLPIGADAVTLIEHTVAYATFPNKGKAVVPHGVLEIRNGDGDLVWSWDHDGAKPRQIIPPHVAAEMAMMMSHVVSEGTGRRAQLDGIPTAGKTGTTNDYRDAWFLGYTGNFVGGVWMGNDDFSPTNRLVGGSLPAQTWHDIMVTTHSGVEIRELAGVGMGTKLPQPRVAYGAPKPPEITPGPPPVLTKRGVEILVRLQKMLEDAGKTATRTSSDETARPDRPASSSALPSPDSFAAALPRGKASPFSRQN